MSVTNVPMRRNARIYEGWSQKEENGWVIGFALNAEMRGMQADKLYFWTDVIFEHKDGSISLEAIGNVRFTDWERNSAP